MNKWTTEAVRIAAGLKPFEEMRNDTILRTTRPRLSEKAWLGSLDRQTGRTTKMICEAIANAKNGESTCIVTLRPQEELINEKILAILAKSKLVIVQDLIKVTTLSNYFNHVLVEHIITE